MLTRITNNLLFYLYQRDTDLFVVFHRRYGVVDKRFCVEGGSRCGKGEGLFIFAAEGGRELTELLNVYSHEAQSRLSIASRSGSGEKIMLVNRSFGLGFEG